MRKTCGQIYAQVVSDLWETCSSFTHSTTKFHNMGTKPLVLSTFCQHSDQAFTQDFLTTSSGEYAVMTTFHTTNNVYNKGN